MTNFFITKLFLHLGISKVIVNNVVQTEDHWPMKEKKVVNFLSLAIIFNAVLPALFLSKIISLAANQSSGVMVDITFPIMHNRIWV